MRRTAPRRAAAALLAACCLGIAARGADETTALLERACVGARPTPQDQNLAQEYLADWVDTEPADVYLRVAFQQIARGLPPGHGELDAVRRLRDVYVQRRQEADARAAGSPVTTADGRVVGPNARGPRRLGGRELAEVAVVAGIALVVLAAGVVAILVLRRR